MINALVSVMEAELGAPFVNYQRSSSARMLLIDMGHDQPPTPEVIDSSTGDGCVNNNIRK